MDLSGIASEKVDHEAALIATQKTLTLGEIDLDADDDDVNHNDAAMPGGDLAMNVPLEKFLRDQHADLENMDVVMKMVNTWCDYHMEKGGCDVVDPTMSKHLGDFIKLKTTLVNATQHAHQWVQDGEGLKQRWSAAALAMKKRQYTMAIQMCPERNPEDSDDYKLAITKVVDWEQSKLDAHQHQTLKLQDMMEEAKVNMEKRVECISMGVCDWIKVHYKGGGCPVDGDMNNVDTEMMAELESIVDNASRHGLEAWVSID